MAKLIVNGEEVNLGGGSSSGSSIPCGVIQIWSGITAPNGWLLCDGSEYPIADYPELATFFESQHGSKNFFGGDGESMFAVPNLSGRFILGANMAHDVGETGGEEEVTLTMEQMPIHNHTISYYKSSGAQIYPSGQSTGVGQNGASTGLAGGSKPHPNMSPYFTLCYIIKV